MHPHRIYLIMSAAGVMLWLVTLSFIYLLVMGMPIHDFRLWRLERNFRKTEDYHPMESRLLQKVRYLGGPSEHGSGTCGFFVGELRTSPLPKEKIKQAYHNRSIKSINYFGRTPLKTLFFDEDAWPLDSPLGDWWDEWYLGGIATGTPSTAYFIFASQEGYHFLGDRRCDD